MKGSPHILSEWGDTKRSNPANLFQTFQSNRTAGRNNSNLKNTPTYSNTRNQIQWRRDHGAWADLLSAIQVGVKPTLIALPPANSRRCPRAPPLLDEAIAEYLALGVIRRMSPQATQMTRHWSTVFGPRKADSGKIRMITDFL